MPNTDNETREGGLYLQPPGSQDTLVQPQDAQTAAEDSKVPASVQGPSLLRHFQILANTILPKTTLKDDWERDIAPSVPPGLLHPEWAGTRLDTVRFVPQVWDRNTDNAVDQAMTNLSAHATSIGSQALYDPNSLQSRRKVGMMDKVVHSIKTSVALETAGHTEDHPLRYLRDKLNTKLDKTFHPPVKMSDTGYQDRSASGWSRAVNKGVMYEDITQLEEADLNFVIENLAMAEKRSGK